MTNDFQQTVADTISRHALIDDSCRPVIVGLSGGADSVALLHALHALGHDCIAANCNFHLRADESDRDSLFARDYAARLDVRFIATDFNVADYLNSNPSTSIEEACRNLRYRWFGELMAETNAQAIAVGHHLDDSCETILFNLQRGTGFTGLIGISPKNDRGIIRPLINLTRRQILDYCRENGLLFVTDSSNLANDFSRNKLRNIVIPAFENQFPNLRKGLIRTARNLSETSELYEAMLSEKRAQYTSVNHAIRLSELIASERNPSLILYEWFKSLGLTRTQASDIVAAAAATGSRFLTSHATFIIDRGALIIHSGSDSHLPSISDFRFETLPIADFQPVKDRRTALFSTDILSGEAPTVRQWHTADRIQPFGMKGTKKVSDIFSDAKIPLSVKSRIPLLVKNDNILWVTGLRQSAKLKVKPSDTHFVKVTYLGPDLF